MIIKPDYASGELYNMIEQKDIRRINIGGQRHYIENKQGALPYKSVTTFEKIYHLGDDGLQRWSDGYINDFGLQAKIAYVQGRAAYGTYLHIKTQDLLLGKEIKLTYKDVFAEISDYMYKNKVYLDIDDLTRTYIEDVAALLRWYEIYEPEVVGLEVPLLADKLMLSGTVDFIVKVHDKKNLYTAAAKKAFQVKDQSIAKKLAIIDLKSGRKGFFKAHKYQLNIYKMMWNELVKDQKYKITDQVYNLAPANWKGQEPKFNYTNQNNDWLCSELQHYFRLYKFHLQTERSEQITEISGTYNGNVSSMIKQVGRVEQFIKGLND